MTLHWFIKRLKKIYNVWGIYYPNRDVVELWFHLENSEICLCYSGETVRESKFDDMLRRVKDDLTFEGGSDE